jgi:hypothetical protein
MKNNVHGVKLLMVFDERQQQAGGKRTLLLFFAQSLWLMLAIYPVKCSIYHSNNFGWQNREALKNIFYERK